MNRERDGSEGIPSFEIEEKHAILINDAARQRLQGDKTEAANFDRSFRDVTSEGDRAIAQRLRDHSDAEFRYIYADMNNKVAKSELTFSHSQDEIIDARRIAPPSVTTPDHCLNSPGFWDEHGRSLKEYLDAGREYLSIKARLDDGVSLEDLKKDKELGNAVNFWYGNPIKVEGYKGCYFTDDGNHRVELAHMLDLGEIPVSVRYAIPRESSE